MNFYRHYIGDFQRDTGHLSLSERGAYRALMDHYYATETALPNDLDALCRVAGAVNTPERKAVSAAMRMFEVRDGALWHKRIEAELEKAGERSDTNRVIALAREERKRVERVARTEHEQSTIRAPDVPRTEHALSTKPVFQEEAKKKQQLCADESSASFGKFWSAYPRKVAKPHAMRTWVKLKIGDGELQAVLSAVEAAKKSDPQWNRDGGQFIPHPATWLNDRRWEDEGVKLNGHAVDEAPARGPGGWV